MKVGINARYLGESLEEFGQYIHYLLSALAEIDKENHYILFIPKDIEGFDAKTSLGDNFEIRVIPEFFQFLNPEFSRIWWEQIQLPKAAKKAQVDLVYSPYPHAPYKDYKIPWVSTCTEVFLWDLQKRKKQGKSSANFIIRSFSKVNKIITPSVAAKFTALNLFSKKEENIFVLYSGKNPGFSKEIKDTDIQIVKKRYNLQKPFLFYIGGFKYHQNVDRLLEAFTKVQNNFDIDLVLGGDTGSSGSLLHKEFTNIAYKARKLGISNNVKFVGLLPIQDLTVLYNLALVFVYIPFLSSLGLCIVEALSCGIPVVISKAPGFMEIVCGAGILVDPFNSEDIASGIAKVLTDNNLRERLKKEGLVQAEKFSWRNTAGEILQIFKSIEKSNTNKSSEF